MVDRLGADPDPRVDLVAVGYHAHLLGTEMYMEVRTPMESSGAVALHRLLKWNCGCVEYTIYLKNE